MGNRTFFKNVKENKMTLGDIFSDVLKKHTPEESARVFIAGTEITTPKEEDMLSQWNKPYLFARFFGLCLVSLLLLWGLGNMAGFGRAFYILMLGLCFIVPVTMLILMWEMNIPRDISLVEIIKIVGVGGVLSIVVTIFAEYVLGGTAPMWAGLTEEPAKLLIIYYLLKKKNRNYILDGMLLGMAVGTGFAVFESIMYTMDAFAEAGMLGGLVQAVVRALTAISGHGFYAALYGGGLMMAKGREELEARHLFSLDFLKYFILAIALHAYHNSGISFGLPAFLGGLLATEWILEAMVAIFLLLDLMKKGVNQAVKVCAQKNGGRVTMAVNRGNAGGNYQSTSQIVLEAISGPYMGRTFSILAGQQMTVGRVEGKNGIALPACKNISSMHCQISAESNQLKIKDLNSTNGTYIGEQKLSAYQERYIGDGMVIYLADKNCGFRVRVQ